MRDFDASFDLCQRSPIGDVPVDPLALILEFQPVIRNQLSALDSVCPGVLRLLRLDSDPRHEDGLR